MLRWLLYAFILSSLHVSGQLDTCIEQFSHHDLNPARHGKHQSIETFFQTKEIKKFNVKKLPNAVILQNGYAQSHIKNPQLWKPDYTITEVTDVEVVFTKYPLKKERWRTNYDKLLSDRLKELFKLDPKLNCKGINYRLILQTDCTTDSACRQFYHGIVIRYKIVPKKKPRPRPNNNQHLIDSAEKVPFHKQVEEFIKEQGGLIDSTAYKIFDRHPEWRKSLVVMDWISSMYPYGASVVLWHSLHFNKSGIKFYTFFNDGDNKPEYAKQLGRAGGIYNEKADNLDQVIKLFRYVKKMGTGGDIPENDIEALLAGMKAFPDFTELILIADNTACVRDYVLSDSIHFPIKIILCGTENGINPMYLNLAAKTKGSIHTIEEDIYSMQESGIGNEQINIGGVDFKKNLDGLYVRTDGKKEEECQQYYNYTPKVKVPKIKDLPKPVKKTSAWKRFLQKLGLAKK